MLQRTIMMSVFYGALSFSAGAALANEAEEASLRRLEDGQSVVVLSESASPMSVKLLSGRTLKLWEQIN